MITAIHKIWKKKKEEQHQQHQNGKKEKEKEKNKNVDGLFLNFRIFSRDFPFKKILLIYCSIENVTYPINYNISFDNDSLSI